LDRRVLLIALLVLVAGLAVIGYQQLTAEPIFTGILIDPPKAAADFTVQTDKGEVHLSDFRGKYVLLYFGYTFCPDVCPTTLSTLKKAFSRAGNAADNYQVIFISVDPRRDTPERLGEYVRFFNPDFIGATNTADEINRITNEFGILYHINDAESQKDYTVDHTSVVIAIDPQGNQRLIWNHEAEYKQIAADMKSLLRQAP
jgi:protein SCO1/2